MPVTRKLLSVALALYVLLVSFPGAYRPIEHGLDNAWVYAVNHLIHSDFRFGRDVVFNEGPLGFLLNPLDIGNNLAIAISFLILIHACFATLLVRNLWNSRPGQGVIFSLGCILAFSLGLRYEFHLLLVLGIALASFQPGQRGWLPMLGIASALAGVTVYMKFSIGVAAAGMLAVASLRDWRRSLPIALGTYAGSVLLLGLFFTGSFADLFRWMSLSFEISQGYFVAMSVDNNLALVVLAVVSLIALALLAIGRRDSAFIVVLFSPPVFIALKNSFVRHHGRLFFPLTVAVASFIVLRASRRSLAPAVVALAVVAGLSLGASAVPACECGFQPSTSAGTVGFDHIRSTLSLRRTRARLRDETNALLIQALPPRWRSLIGSAYVDVVPWELAITEAEGLRWNPNPVLQTYNAYTRRLDAISAAHFREPGRPQFVIARLVDIDNRNPFISSPQTWLELVAGYRLIEVSQSNGLSLLEEKSRQLSVTQLSRTESDLEGWVAPPRAPGPITLSFELRNRWFHYPAALLWRIPPIHLEVEFENGASKLYRLIPETAENALVAPLPESQEDFAELFAGTLERPVKRVRVVGPGRAYYHLETSIIWRELRRS